MIRTSSMRRAVLGAALAGAVAGCTTLAAPDLSPLSLTAAEVDAERVRIASAVGGGTLATILNPNALMVNLSSVVEPIGTSDMSVYYPNVRHPTFAGVVPPAFRGRTFRAASTGWTSVASATAPSNGIVIVVGRNPLALRDDPPIGTVTVLDSSTTTDAVGIFLVRDTAGQLVLEARIAQSLRTNVISGAGRLRTSGGDFASFVSSYGPLLANSARMTLAGRATSWSFSADPPRTPFATELDVGGQSLRAVSDGDSTVYRLGTRRLGVRMFGDSTIRTPHPEAPALVSSMERFLMATPRAEPVGILFSLLLNAVLPRTLP